MAARGARRPSCAGSARLGRRALRPGSAVVSARAHRRAVARAGAVVGAVASPGRRAREPTPIALLSALEVGAGTGKATVLLAARGSTVHAIQPDLVTAAQAARNCARLPGVTIEHSDFESATVRRGHRSSHAAGSWHWVDHARKYPLAREALVPGGEPWRLSGTLPIGVAARATSPWPRPIAVPAPSSWSQVRCSRANARGSTSARTSRRRSPLHWLVRRADSAPPLDARMTCGRLRRAA